MGSWGALRVVPPILLPSAGVILESEVLHRRAYNAAFQHFDIRCGGGEDRVVWSEEFYDDLQNRVGGGKPKMRDYFGEDDGKTAEAVLPTLTPAGPVA